MDTKDTKLKDKQTEKRNNRWMNKCTADEGIQRQTNRMNRRAEVLSDGQMGGQIVNRKP